MSWRTPAALAELMDTRDQILHTLTVAMAGRNLRRYRHDTGELGWVLFERDTLRDAVNERRTGRGLESVTSADIKAVESQAEGHIDYAEKLAYACARLALGYEED